MRRAEEARDLAGELHDVVHHVRQGHERGQAPALGQRRAQDRAVARRVVAVVAQELEVPLERVAAAQRRERRRVVVGHRVVHAPDDRQPVHHPRCVRQVLADPQPRHAGRDRAELRRGPPPGRSASCRTCRCGWDRRNRRSGCTSGSAPARLVPAPPSPRPRPAAAPAASRPSEPKAADPKQSPAAQVLVISHWVTGHWSLVIGHRSLAAWCRALACLAWPLLLSSRTVAGRLLPGSSSSPPPARLASGRVTDDR